MRPEKCPFHFMNPEDVPIHPVTVATRPRNILHMSHEHPVYVTLHPVNVTFNPEYVTYPVINSSKYIKLYWLN